MQAFELLDNEMDELRHESESATKIFKNRMIEMNAARAKKVDANMKIVQDAEARIN
jgi:hypothetical protein